MKRILWTGLLVIATLATAGCEDIPGVLTVTKNFNVLVKGKSKTVTTGEHKMSLDFKKNKVVATIEVDGGSLKVDLAVPAGSQIPNNGPFELQSSQSGQPFDVHGAVQTTVTESDTQSGYESCQYQAYDTICDQNGCHTVPVNRQGSRTIVFYYRDTRQAMHFDMTTAASAQDKYAHFNGEANYSEKIVIREGQCF